MVTDLLPVVRNLLRTDTGRLHPLRVLGRFGFLQLRRRLSPAPFSFVTATGTRAFVDSRGDFAGITSLYYLQLPILNELVFACHCLREGDVLWDVGANQGFWSLLMAGRGVQAHCFEPAPSTFANQKRQFEFQDSPFRERLHGHNVGLAARPGKMRLTADLGPGNHLLEDGQHYSGQSVTVDISTVDDFLAFTPPPQLMKIDVEGWTLSVLEGARATLARPELLGLVIETFRPTNGDKPEVREAEALLSEFGFRPFSYDPRTRVLRALTGPRDGRDDTIYVRDPERLAPRLSAATPITCFGERF